MKVYDERMSSGVREALNELEDCARQLGFPNARFYWADANAGAEEMSETIEECLCDGEEGELEATLHLGTVDFLQPNA